MGIRSAIKGLWRRPRSSPPWRSPRVVLSHIVSIAGLAAFEEAVLLSRDRRTLIRTCAARSGIPEAVLIRKLARRLRLRHAAAIPVFDVNELPRPISFSELRRAGAVPLVVRGRYCLACVDPSLPDKRLLDEAPVLASWTDISRALEQSEQLACISHSSGQPPSCGITGQ